MLVLTPLGVILLKRRDEMETGFILYFVLVLRVIASLIGYKVVEWDSDEKFVVFIGPLLMVFGILMLAIGKVFPIEVLIPLYAIGEIILSQITKKGTGVCLWFAAISLGTLGLFLLNN